MAYDTLTIPTEQDTLRQQIDESRSSLGEKLELLEGKMTGTVQAATASVADATASVVDTVMNATASVSETVDNVNAAVQGTVENVRNSVSDAVDSVKETFDLTQQVRNYPWQMVVGAVAVGYIGTQFLKPERRSTRASDRRSEWNGLDQARSGIQRSPASAESLYGEEPGVRQDSESNGVQRISAPVDVAREPLSATFPTWMGHLADTFGPEISQLRGLAIGTSLGLVRDMITNSVPETLRIQIAEVVDGFADKLGGQHSHGSVLQPAHNPEARHRDHFPEVSAVDAS